MAVTSPRAWSRTARRVLGTGAVAGTALVTLALPASAHTPQAQASCNPETGKTTLTIALQDYDGRKDNAVGAKDGDNVLVDTTFKSSYRNSFEVSGAVEHTFVVQVKAWDDPDGSKGFTKTFRLPTAACVAPPTTTTTVPPTTTTTTVAPTTTTSEAPPAPTTTPPADQGGLAQTGASVGLPLAIGGLLIVGGGALLLVVRKRRTN